MTRVLAAGPAQVRTQSTVSRRDCDAESYERGYSHGYYHGCGPGDGEHFLIIPNYKSTKWTMTATATRPVHSDYEEGYHTGYGAQATWVATSRLGEAEGDAGPAPVRTTATEAPPPAAAPSLRRRLRGVVCAAYVML